MRPASPWPFMAIAFALAAPTLAGAEARAPGDRQVAAEAAAMLAAAHPADGPGAAAVVMRRGRVVFIGGRGLADLPAARAITPDTVFRLGSITKQFTAAVILQLVADRRIGLDDPLSRFFPDFSPPGADATVRQLLNHLSGLQDYSKVPGWMGGPASLQPHSTAELVALTRDRPAVSPAGTKWEYNNGGYALLGAIIEQITGKPWHQVVVERIGRPLGLRTLTYAGAPDRPRAAQGYSLVEGRYVPARGVHISVAGAAGGLSASVADLARWAAALHGGRVVSPALYAEMIRPARPNGGATAPYGFGLRLSRLKGEAALVHGGAGRGLDAESAYIPTAQLFVAVLSNTDDPATDPSVLVRRIALSALGHPVPAFTAVELSPTAVAPWFGNYSAAGEPAVRFFERGGKLWLGRGDEERQAFAAGNGRFFLGPESLLWFRFVEGQGAPVLELHDPGRAMPFRAVRTAAAPVPLQVDPATLRTYVGTYLTEGPALTVAIGADGVLTIGPAGQSPARLRPVSATEFRLESGTMRVVFHPAEGRVDRVTLYRGARELHGERVVAP